MPLRCQLAREELTCGLARERANERSQWFVAMIARRASLRSLLRSPIALVSRPDHNAAAPFASLMFALELSTSAIALLAAITQLPDDGRSRRRGQARSPSGTERSGVA